MGEVPGIIAALSDPGPVSSSMQRSSAQEETLPGHHFAPTIPSPAGLMGARSPRVLWKTKAQCHPQGAIRCRQSTAATGFCAHTPAPAQPRGLRSPFVSTITSPLTAVYLLLAWH